MSDKKLSPLPVPAVPVAPVHTIKCLPDNSVEIVNTYPDGSPQVLVLPKSIGVLIKIKGS